MDISNGFDVYVYHVITSPLNEYSRDFSASGIGAHPDPVVALSRALTEAAQSRLTIISGSRDDISPTSYYLELKNRFISEAFNIQSGERMFPSNSKPLAKRFLDQDLKGIINALVEKGYDKVLLADLSKPGLGVSVVKVIIPGMLHKY